MHDLVDVLGRNWFSFVPILLLATAGLLRFARKTTVQRRFSLADYDPKDVANIYRTLRGGALGSQPSNLGLTDPPPDKAYGVVMDWGLEEAVATITGFTSGDASLYVSSGGGVIGGGGHEDVREAAMHFVEVAQERVRWMQPTREFPLPRIGRVKFYVLTGGGVLTTDVRVEPIEASYAALWNAGQMLLAAIRESDGRAAGASLTPAAPTV